MKRGRSTGKPNKQESARIVAAKEGPEEWRPISFAAHIEVSNHGRVRSLDRVIPYVDGRDRPMIGRMRKLCVTAGNGYLHVTIAGKLHYVHRLVAAEFVEGYEPGKVVNHKDGDKKHNHASNLEWTTHRGNSHHARDVLGVRPAKPKTKTPVIGVSLETGEEVRFGRMEDAKASGFNPASICKVCKGRNQSHHGFAWRYADA